MKTISKSRGKNRSAGIGEMEFEEMFNTWYDALTNYLYYKSGDIDLARDIVQETFLKIWEIKTEIRINTARSLLYTIASNIYRNKYHHQKVIFRFANTYTEKRISESPEFEMELKEFDQRLQKALAGLSEKNREVFLMNRIDGLTYNDIAQNLGISIKAVEKRMKNAMSFLRNKIDMKI